jgi:putative membrane protein
MQSSEVVRESDIFAITRPAPSLMTYYLLSSFVLGPLFFIPLVPLYFRYHTLRYRFDEEGISMRWGILFRREINLTYARIQDIHLRSNFVERWLNLARIEVQTASGSSGAEMTLEGLHEFEAIRDYLYTRMRGSHDRRSAAARAPAVGSGTGDAMLDELAEALREVTNELRAVRRSLEARAKGGDDV